MIGQQIELFKTLLRESQVLTEIIQQQLIISTSKPTHEYFTMQC